MVGARSRRFVSAFVLVLLAQGTLVGIASGVSTPPPTPVPPHGSPSPFVSELKTPAPSATAPLLRAPVGLLADLDTGQILFQKNATLRRPIASVAKLMTALITLERVDDLNDVVTVSETAAPSLSGYHGSELDLRPGERISVENLLIGLLIQSSNDAAIALAEHVAGTVPRFVRSMNARAKRLGMRRTTFASPSGLDDRGRSSASDLVLLTRAVMEYREIERIVSTQFAEVPSPKGPPREIQNRNVLLWLYPGAIGVKTGYTVDARFCLVAAAERDGLRLMAVVLGAPEEPFSDSAALLNFGFEAFERRTFVEEGTDLGPVQIPGGTVRGVAGETLRALVPTAAAAKAIDRVVVDEGAGFPPRPGERIAGLRVRIPGLELGEVPVLAAEIPPPPPPEPGPWWLRTAGSVLEAVGGAVRSLLG